MRVSKTVHKIASSRERYRGVLDRVTSNITSSTNNSPPIKLGTLGSDILKSLKVIDTDVIKVLQNIKQGSSINLYKWFEEFFSNSEQDDCFVLIKKQLDKIINRYPETETLLREILKI